ncbi:hypothetical protein ABT354_15645 [Streptomyces sp. NPDC000594]|uniref:hypothetical protein n=1 Tax=Streptomyces sp. NPDC000594 TaxID=3154261 RepID=UPI00332F0711
MRCPRCGGETLSDPEFPREVRCMNCWHAAGIVHPLGCPGLVFHRPPVPRDLQGRP